MTQPDDLRADLARAAAISSYALIHCLCERAGVPLRTTSDNLARFGRGDHQNLNPHDARQLARFLYETETGRLLRNHARSPLPSFDKIVATLRSGALQPTARPFAGASFHLLHGSHLKAEHLVVRAIVLATTSYGLITFRNHLEDNQTFARAIRKAGGVLNVFEGRPHLLTLHEDNSRGWNLIVADHVLPDTGPIASFTGLMLGMTRNGLPFRRAVLLTPTPTPMTMEEMEPNTGIMLFEEWPPDIQEGFLELARCYPEDPFADHVLALRGRNRR